MSDPQSYKDTLEQALDEWGEPTQIDIAIEELSELTTELARQQRGTGNPEDVVDELADVEIMLDQLALIFDHEAINERIEFKLERLRDQLEEVDDVE